MKRGQANKSKYPFVSVIIPVYNDSERLKSCLYALNRQTYPKNNYEIIVVDNNSDDDVKNITNKFNNVILTREKKQCRSAARNKGIRLAKAKILAFIDADCVPAVNWIEKGVEKLLSSPKIGIVGGEVKVLLKNFHVPTAVELYDIYNWFSQKRLVEKHKFSGGGNLFTFRKIFDEVGFFDENLKTADDMDWCKRVFFFGYLIQYGKDVIVSHPPRHSFQELYKKRIKLMDGKYAIIKKENWEKA